MILKTLVESTLDQRHVDEKLRDLSLTKQIQLIYEWTKTHKLDKKTFEYAVKRYLLREE